MQARKIDSAHPGLKQRRLVTTVLLATVLAAGQLTAQGPRLSRSGQSYRQSVPAYLQAIPPQDSIRVRPNHWKRGARIGVAVAVIPLTLFAVTEGCKDFPGTQAKCAVAATGFIALTGVFGGLVGGFIGSFFPRSEPAPASSGVR